MPYARKAKRYGNCSISEKKQEHEAKTVTSALHVLREEKANTQKWLLSLQTKFQEEKDGRLAEGQQLRYKYNKLVAQL